MRRDQRRAITPASPTAVAGDTGRVLPLAALVLTTVAAAIKAAAPTTRAAAAARTRAGAVVARSQALRTADLTICALRRDALHSKFEANARAMLRSTIEGEFPIRAQRNGEGLTRYNKVDESWRADLRFRAGSG